MAKFLQIAGVGLVCTGLVMLHPALGVITLGATLALLGRGLERRA